MAFEPGDIVLFESAVAGKMKYHLCICVDLENELHSFVFLNSEGAGFRDQFEIDCARIPEMPLSRTGRTYFDCPTIHRKTTDQLGKLRSKRICQLPKGVATDFAVFAHRISSMTRKDKAALLSMLEAVVRA